jgi:hypothetical protein
MGASKYSRTDVPRPAGVRRLAHLRVTGTPAPFDSDLTQETNPSKPQRKLRGDPKPIRGVYLSPLTVSDD